MVFYHQILKFFSNSQGCQELFLLIFHQNTINNDLFKTEDEFLETNTANKYSILKHIDDDFKINGLFEFIMDYPEIKEYGRWTQTKNPLNAKPDEDVDVQEKESTWDKEVNFIGLHQSSLKTACFIEGTDAVSQNTGLPNWYYAIGQKIKWESTNYLAGPYYSNKKLNIHQVFLWLKIADLHLLKRIFHHHTQQNLFIFFKLSILCNIMFLL